MVLRLQDNASSDESSTFTYLLVLHSLNNFNFTEVQIKIPTHPWSNHTASNAYVARLIPGESPSVVPVVPFLAV